MSFDDFPDQLKKSLEKQNTAEAPAQRRKSFQLGTASDAREEGYEDEEQESEEEELPEELAPEEEEEQEEEEATGPALQLGLPEPEPALVLQLCESTEPLHPSLRNLQITASKRFGKVMGPNAQTTKITRQWFDALEQRHFFLALGMPGHALNDMLDRHVGIEVIEAWVMGKQETPWAIRRILTLENLMARRSEWNRKRMPNRAEMEEAIAKLPHNANVAAILGGFEKIAGTKGVFLTQPEERVQGLLARVAGPGNNPSHLAAGKRTRAIGVGLEKPNSYCYTLSRKSIDESTGLPRMTPRQVMAAVNRAAALERRFNVAYSIRRKDSHLPYTTENLEFVPTEELRAS